ncbi:DUF6263 family protein [Sphingobacterium paucimobilis]|uniref:Uncharacterized protein n=1 Tax=Sphingobacterium paucimobilis HER1398 TaxID=1346330 RepID=U2H9A1_9SPHI|nr:DUF6263 family protein [Sphingobacterium paucimobilis]ERJ58316.1 hypothetical protein M472_05990 [Sphingobacterium paucimobilis HER1398]
MKTFFTTALIAFAILLDVQAQEKIVFKLNPEKGKVMTFEMNMKSDIEGTQNMIMDMKMKMKMSATNVTDSTIQYQTKYTQLKTDINAGFISISYDSAVEPNDQMGKTMANQLKPLLENTLTITMNHRAQVVDMDFPNVPDAAFDRSSIQGMSVPYPTHPIAVGDSWENEIALPQLGIKGKNTNTFTEKTVDGYKITVAGTYMDDSGKVLGTTSGYYIVDTNTFFTKTSNIDTELEVQGNKIKSSMELNESR